MRFRELAVLFSFLTSNDWRAFNNGSIVQYCYEILVGTWLVFCRVKAWSCIRSPRRPTRSFVGEHPASPATAQSMELSICAIFVPHTHITCSLPLATSAVVRSEGHNAGAFNRYIPACVYTRQGSSSQINVAPCTMERMTLRSSKLNA